MRKRKIMIIMLCIFWVQGISVSAQSFRYSNFYDLNGGSGGFLDVVLTENGNIQAVGATLNLSDNYGRHDGFHVQQSDGGELLNLYGFSATEQSFNTRAITISDNGSMYVAGYYCDFRVESPSYCDFFFQKLDESGDTLFTSIYERKDTCDALLDIVQTRPNKIMLIGWTCNDTTQNNTDLMFLTVDTLGNELNRVIYGGGLQIL